MKSWFAKLRISAAMDAGCELSASLRRSINRSEQLRRFEEEVRGVDRELKGAAPKTEPPPGLHRAIMGAVRAAEEPAQAPRALAAWRWVAAPVVTLLALVMAWYVLRGPVRPPTRDTQSLAAATTALEMSGQLAQTMPAAVVAPLSDELERLNRDLDNTAQFILASLP